MIFALPLILIITLIAAVSGGTNKNSETGGVGESGGVSSAVIVNTALTQLGNVGGEKFWSWYGFTGWQNWCACFVSWCADQCGYVEAGICPKFAGCTSQGVPWFKERGLWQERGYVPSAGDYIFIDWNGSGDYDHVGLVEKCEDGVVYTVEGNRNTDAAGVSYDEGICIRSSYGVNSTYIAGYGTPSYPASDATAAATPSVTGNVTTAGASVWLLPPVATRKRGRFYEV